MATPMATIEDVQGLIPEAGSAEGKQPDQAALGQVLQLMYGKHLGQVVCVAAKLGIADLIAAGDVRTEALAASLKANAASLRRFLYSLASCGMLTETSPDRWSLTAAGNMLRGDVPGSVRDLAGLFATQEHMAAWSALENSVLTGGSGFQHVYGEDGWSYMQKHPDFRNSFNNAMSSLAGSVHRAIVSSYDFSSTELLVDVGGGHGHLLAQILQRNPQLRGMVLDMPHVVNGAGAYFAECGLSDRAKGVPGSFFDTVPAEADAYIMTAILHDWDDAACVKILRNCRSAMKPSGKVLVGDFVLKPSNQQDFGRMIDLEMMAMTQSGRERTEEDFRDIFAQAGLSLSRIIPLPSGTCLLEALPV